jgi:hypothetical protein
MTAVSFYDPFDTWYTRTKAFCSQLHNKMPSLTCTLQYLLSAIHYNICSHVRFKISAISYILNTRSQLFITMFATSGVSNNIWYLLLALLAF